MLALLSLATLAHGGQDLVLNDLPIRDGVTADVHLRLLQRPGSSCNAGTLLALHGATASGATLEPLAEAILGRPIHGRPVCRVVTMDLPGHGSSPAPTGALFGELTLEDYAAVLLGALERLPDEGVRPETLIGHSMGGLVIQLAQQALVDQGSSLHDAHRIDHALLLAPALPASVPWAFRDSGAGLGLMQLFGVPDRALGDVFALPPALAPAVYFGRLDGTLASNAIPADDLIAAGWIGVESIGAMSGMLGLAPFAPSEVDPGLFADEHGTRLDLIAFEQDSTIFATDLEALFPYLTGRVLGEPGFLVVHGPDAVHGLPQADPLGLVDALEGHVDLP